MNLLTYADILNPRNFPNRDQVVKDIQKVQKHLGVVKELAEECQQERMDKGTVFEKDGTRQVQDVIEGIRIAWSAHKKQPEWMIAKEAKKKGLCRKRA